MRKTLGTLVTAAAIAVAAVAAAAGPALADPPAGTVPAALDIVSVGSDTTQAVSNQYSLDFNAQVPAPANKYYSWDAIPQPSNITPKTGAGSIARPNGSTSGITELNATTDAVVDIARSSRGPKVGTDPTTDWFIAFARDAVGWSAYTGGNAPSTLSYTDLQGIYTCSITKWNQITDIPGYTGGATTINVYVPQSGSGTRSFFLSALGITAATESCWSTTTPEENEGTDAVFVGNKDAIFPYSIAHYVGQKYKGKGSGTDKPGVLDALRSVTNASGTFAQVDTVAQTINPAFAKSTNTAFGRNVYNVVRSGDWGDAVRGPVLKKLLASAGSGGWICGTAGTTDTTNFGFLALNAAAGAGPCGAISHT